MIRRPYRIREAADACNLSPRSLRRLCEAGKIRAFRPTGETGHWRIPAEEVERLQRGEIDFARPRPPRCEPPTLVIRRRYVPRPT